MKMDSKFLFLPIFLIIALHSSKLSLARREVSVKTFTRPTIHITSVVPKGSSVITLDIDGDKGSDKGSSQLSPGQEYQLKTDEDTAYYVTAVFGLRFAGFTAYEPSRDKGRVDIFFRANIEGFDISYDKKIWKSIAPWETE